MLILNAFSLNMIPSGHPVVVRSIPTNHRLVAALYTLGGEVLESAVGHADTARVFSQVLGIEVPCERRTVALYPGDMAIVGQYRGPRLPEGATELPEGAAIQWFIVEIWRDADAHLPVTHAVDVPNAGVAT